MLKYYCDCKFLHFPEYPSALLSEVKYNRYWPRQSRKSKRVLLACLVDAFISCRRNSQRVDIVNYGQMLHAASTWMPQYGKWKSYICFIFISWQWNFATNALPGCSSAKKKASVISGKCTVDVLKLRQLHQEVHSVLHKSCVLMDVSKLRHSVSPCMIAVKLSYSLRSDLLFLKDKQQKWFMVIVVACFLYSLFFFLARLSSSHFPKHLSQTTSAPLSCPALCILLSVLCLCVNGD